MIIDAAYAPFGEQYADNATATMFTGQWAATQFDFYDFPYREYHSIQGRWLSPDPAGLGAANPANPQSWNRYAYVLNNPLANVDPLGLDGYASGPDCGEPGELSCQQYFEGAGWTPALWSPEGDFCGAEFSACYSNPITGAYVELLGPNSGYMYLSAANESIIDEETGQPLGFFIGNWTLFTMSTLPVGPNGTPPGSGGGNSWWGTFASSFVSGFSLQSARQPGESRLGCMQRAASALGGSQIASAWSALMASGIIGKLASVPVQLMPDEPGLGATVTWLDKLVLDGGVDTLYQQAGLAASDAVAASSGSLLAYTGGVGAGLLGGLAVACR